MDLFETKIHQSVYVHCTNILSTVKLACVIEDSFDHLLVFAFAQNLKNLMSPLINVFVRTDSSATLVAIVFAQNSRKLYMTGSFFL